ncbi:hypothetical protein AX14_004475 [Amanita brunnescens Koide BX004]|nr:hypothetical protein AX14_004475 [Amanita brunnescens Koide BX004]
MSSPKKSVQVAKHTETKSCSELLYPAHFSVAADSNYNDQEDFEPVDTPLMPLRLQDMKLCLDYTNLPTFDCVEMHSTSTVGSTNHQLETYSPVWAALNADDDLLSRRHFRKAIRSSSAC